jgi:hypothetical protein
VAAVFFSIEAQYAEIAKIAAAAIAIVQGLDNKLAILATVFAQVDAVFTFSETVFAVSAATPAIVEALRLSYAAFAALRAAINIGKIPITALNPF